MPVAFSFEAKPDHLRVEVAGERVEGRYMQEMISGWSRVAEECRAKGIHRMLVINRLTGRSPSADAYQIASAVPSLFQGLSVRMAQVVIGDEGSKRVNKFAEDVAVNRGFEARMFGDEASALGWLLGS